MNERNKQIIEALKKGNTLAQVGRVFNLSRERVRQIAVKNNFKVKNNRTNFKNTMEEHAYYSFMGLPKKLRLEILARDKYTCQYCGKTKDEAILTIDHRIPKNIGGSHKADNLIVACRSCNCKKALKTEKEFRESLKKVIPK